MSSNRYQKEKDFHNQEFDENNRESLSKYYHTVESSADYFEDFIASNSNGKSVLEYGCGPGTYSFQLAEANANVTGVDLSLTAIQQAKQRATKTGFTEQTSFYVMNAEHLALKKNSFDMVCGRAIIHHLDIDTAYKEISRVLKDNGKAIFIEPLGHNPIINLYRRLTPKLRTEDEHPLLQKDVAYAEKYFNKVEQKHFHLFSLLAAPFYKFKFFNLLLKFLDNIDNILFRLFPGTRKYAWVVIMIMSNPK